MRREVRAKNPSQSLNQGNRDLKVTSEPPPTAGQANCLRGQDHSAVTHPSSSHARRCLIWLSHDNRRTRYTAPSAKYLSLTADSLPGINKTETNLFYVLSGNTS
ncbi:hypothetical protein J6590_042766 [Homalodisca vitripennis]|nr:hypothetical protein J6590_042766 [Homalodisca vitripennis]